MGDVNVDNKIVARDEWNGYDYLSCEYGDYYYIGCQLSVDVKTQHY